MFALALGLWLEWRTRWTPARLLTASVLTLCAFLADLSAFLFLLITIGVVVTCDGVRRARSRGVLVWDLVPLAPGTAALRFYMKGSGNVGGVIWNTWKGKVVGLLAIVTGYYNKLIAVIAVSSVLLLALAELLACRITIISFSTLTAGLVMALLFPVSPLVLLTGSPADARFVVPAALLLLLSVNAEFSRNTGRALLIVALALGTIRLAEIWGTWLQLDRRIATEVASFQKISEGATVFPVFVRRRSASGQAGPGPGKRGLLLGDYATGAYTDSICQPDAATHSLPTGASFRDPQAPGPDSVVASGPRLRLRPALAARLADSATMISSGQGAALWRVARHHA